MKLKVKPEKIIPASYTVMFDESDEYPGYITQLEPYRDQLRQDIVEWLDTNSPGWKVSFDRGDWGEGPASVSVYFLSEEHARKFVEHFETIPCPNSRSRGDCPHMGKAVTEAKQRQDGKSRCPNCSRPITIMNKYNRDEFMNRDGDGDHTDII
jgi:hypothetical protein